MARPLRLEFPGALYHITTRGNRRENIFLGDEDRRLFLGLLRQVCRRFNWGVYAYCLMSNHYHLLLETQLPNLSRGMRQLNGVYTQRFNRRQKRTGHVFEGRFKALLVQKDRYLLAVSRYVVLNPVRAGIAPGPAGWPWSSYRATVGTAPAPDFLRTAELLANFNAEPKRAVAQYVKFVRDGIDHPGPWDQVRNQLFLGEGKLPLPRDKARTRVRAAEIPREQRQPLAKPLVFYRDSSATRETAMARAYLSGLYTMKAIGDFFGVHYMTVSRAVHDFESGTRVAEDA